MADVLNDLGKQHDAVVRKALRNDFGQGLDDVDDDSLMQAVHQVYYPDTDPEDFSKAIGAMYGGVFIKKPMTQERLGHTFQPNSEQLDVPIMPEVNAVAKGTAKPFIPVGEEQNAAAAGITGLPVGEQGTPAKAILPNWPLLRVAHSFVGGIAHSIMELPADVASSVHAMARDLTSSEIQPLSANENERLKNVGTSWAAFVAPEAKIAELGAPIVADAVKPIVAKVVEHGIKMGATSGALYSGIESVGNGDTPAQIALHTVIGGAGGAVIGGTVAKAFKVATQAFTQKAAEAVADAKVTPVTPTVDRIVKRGLTPQMEKSFSDVLGLYKKGRITVQDAAQQILEGLGQKPTPEHVAAFADKIQSAHRDEFGNFPQYNPDGDVGIGSPFDPSGPQAEYTAPGEQGQLAPNSVGAPTTEDQFQPSTGFDNPTAQDVGHTPPVAPPDQFMQNPPEEMAPFHVPGEVPPQNWGVPQLDQIPLHEQLGPDLQPEDINPPNPPLAVSKSFTDRMEKHPQGFYKDLSSPFNFEGLSPKEQYALASKRMEMQAKMKAADQAAQIGPAQQALLPAPRQLGPEPTGRPADLSAPIWGHTADVFNQDGLAITGEADPETYIGYGADKQEVLIPKDQTMSPNLKGPDATIPLPPGEGKTGKLGGDEAIGIDKKTGESYQIVSKGKDGWNVVDVNHREKTMPFDSMTLPKYLEGKDKGFEDTALGIGQQKQEAVRSALHEIDKLGYRNPINGREIVMGDKVAFEVAPFGDSIVLHSLRSFEHKSGAGTEAMQKLTEIADKHGVKIELTASPLHTDKRIPKVKLIQFYRRFGFKLKADRERMIREPALPAVNRSTAIARLGNRLVASRGPRFDVALKNLQAALDISSVEDLQAAKASKNLASHAYYNHLIDEAIAKKAK